MGIDKIRNREDSLTDDRENKNEDPYSKCMKSNLFQDICNNYWENQFCSKRNDDSNIRCPSMVDSDHNELIDEMREKNTDYEIISERSQYYELPEDKDKYLNIEGLSQAELSIETQISQHFPIDHDSFKTALDNLIQKGMMIGISEIDNIDSTTINPFNLFPFHGGSNKHFIFQNGKNNQKNNRNFISLGMNESISRFFPFQPKLKQCQSFKYQLL